MKGQPDIMTVNHHNQYNGFCIEFKSPSNNYQISEAQRAMKRQYHQNNYRFLISNDYDRIIAYLNKHMMGVRIPCRHCSNSFVSNNSYQNHLQGVHKL